MRPNILIILFIIYGALKGYAQEPVVYIDDAIRENRTKEYRNIIQKTINKNLSLPLTEATEEYWQDAFQAMELINYRAPFADHKVRLAFDSINKRSIAFQRSLLELAYTNYKKVYTKQVHDLLLQTTDSKIFGMAAEYLIAYSTDPLTWGTIINQINERAKANINDAILFSLILRLWPTASSESPLNLTTQTLKEFLPNEVILFSFQRKNRNFPGLAVIRDRKGNFINGEDGSLFSVQQLARSISNLPGYLTNGNTPQGIFKMDGFAVSKANFIGPTPNLQLLLPFETSPQKFLKDYSIADTGWTEALYKKMLPVAWKDRMALYGTYYAGKAGRTEIIAHGTTVNPEYYKTQSWYPQTPTQGCLCTKESWSQEDGRRLESDQQKLVNALKAAGGADGYVIVIELDDQQRPVGINELLPILKPPR